jgi:hypothetical protein
VSTFPYGGALTLKGVEVRNFTYGGFATALSGPIDVYGSRIVGNTNGISASPGSAIGTTALIDRNVIANAAGNITAYGGTVQIHGNLIGTDDSGNASAGGGSQGGISLSGGTTISIVGNVISGTAGSGISMSGNNTVVINGNKIGIGSSGAAVPNAVHGIMSSSTSAIDVRNNIIAFNGGDGYHMPAGVTNNIRFNSIHSNGGKAINLGGSPGQLPNDPNDADAGANGLQNYPVINSVVKNGTTNHDQLVAQHRADLQLRDRLLLQSSATAVPQATNYLDPVALGFAQAGGDTSASPTINGTTVIPGSHDFITATATNTSLGSETSELSSMALSIGGVLSPTSIDFGNVVVNASSNPQNATITSIGASRT